MRKFRQQILSLFHFVVLHILIAINSRIINGQFASDAPVSVRGNPNYDGRALNIPLDLDGTLELYQHWMDQAFSGMFAAVANQKMSKTSENVREEMGRCSKQVKDVISHANCLSRLLKGEFEDKKPIFQNSNSPMKRKSRLELYKSKGQQNYGIKNMELMSSKVPKKFLAQNYGTKFAEEDMQKHKRMRRQSSGKNEKFFVKTAPKYFLRERTAQMSPLGAVAQLLTKSLMAAKNKTEMAEWQNTIEKIRQTSKRRKTMRKQKMEPEKALLKLQQQIAGNGQNNNAGEQIPFGEMDEILERGNRTEIRQIIRMAQRQKSARRNGKKDKKMDPDKLVQLVRQGVTLGFALAGQNTTGWDEKTMRLVSPRFLSVVAEEEMASDNETLSLLSPSLLSMHDDGQGIEKFASLPSLFRALNLRDQQQWLNLIMEAAGINEEAKKIADETEKEEKEVKTVPTIGTAADNGTRLNLTEIWKKSRGMYEKEIRGEDGQPLYFTRENVTERYGEYETRKIDLWEKFMSTFSEKQKFELNRTGFVPMRPEQMRMIYGAQSPFNDTEALHRLSSLNETQIHEGMERDIHNIARLKQWRLQYHPRAEFHSRRRRAVVLSPIVSSPFVLAAPGLSQAVILSPVVLSPVILTPAVFGPFILSPWVFVPVVLSPRVLSPFVVNPWIFSPIILSPLILHPLIIAPGIFNPIVLSPLVLSPLILAPQVFTPVILSPLVLNPLILTPMVGSPLVLSPFVLSPLILSPQALFALVLSPYALSPIIESKLIATALILSPSWLS